MKRTALSLAIAGSFFVGTLGSTAYAGSGHSHEQVAQSENKVSIGATKLNETLTMLSGVGGFSGGNVIVSSGPDGMLIIDDKLDSMTDKLIAALDKIGDSKNLRFIVNTHWHFDHAGGNKELGNTATIVAHTNVRERMSTEQKIDAFEMVIPPSPKSALPVITYDDSVTIHFNGEEIELFHYPSSHTDTDSVVYFSRSNVLHTGDLFFNGLFPFIDIQNGGDVETMADSIADMVERFPADATIVPGHGPLAKMKDLKAFHRMLTDTTALVVKMVEDGMSLEQAQAAGLPKKWDGWTWMIDKPTWIAIIYNSLTK
jgi:cyclase